MTESKSVGGTVYLGAVKDVFSNRIAGTESTKGSAFPLSPLRSSRPFERDLNFAANLVRPTRDLDIERIA